MNLKVGKIRPIQIGKARVSSLDGPGSHPNHLQDPIQLPFRRACRELSQLASACHHVHFILLYVHKSEYLRAIAFRSPHAR